MDLLTLELNYHIAARTWADSGYERRPTDGVSKEEGDGNHNKAKRFGYARDRTALRRAEAAHH